jgi:hypothetical protein
MRSVPSTLALCVLILLTAVARPVGAQEEAQEAAPQGPRIAEAAVCRAVEDRAPVDAGDTFAADTERLFCFTDVRGAEGETIVHVWIHEGTTRARVELEIGADRWRTWSSKRLLPSWTGAWEVKVMTEAGAVLETLAFTVE